MLHDHIKLDVYVNDTKLELTINQVQQITNIYIQSATSPRKITNTNDIQNSNEHGTEFHFEFHVDDTFLHSIIRDTYADKIRQFVDNKLTVLALVITAVASRILFIMSAFHIVIDTLHIAFVVVSSAWALLKIWLCNKEAFKLCTQSFEFWITVIHSIIISIARLLYVEGSPIKHIYILLVLITVYIGSLDAMYCSYSQKLACPVFMATLLSIFCVSVLWQTEYNNIHLQLFDGLNPVPIQSLVTNSQKILAIFFWKQVYNTWRSKYNCRACVLSISPKIVWIESVTPTQQSAPNIKVPIDSCGTKTPQIAHSEIRTLEKTTNDDRESIARSTLNRCVVAFGVDSIDVYVNDTKVELTINQVQQVTEIIESPTSPRGITNTKTNDIQNSNEDGTEFQFEFHVDDTLLHSIIRETSANKIRQLVDHKSILLAIVITGVASRILFIISTFHNLELHILIDTLHIALMVVSHAWALLKIWLCNKEAFKLCTQSFDFWIKVIHSIIISIARLVYVEGSPIKHIYILLVLGTVYVGSLDAMHCSYRKKLAWPVLIATMLSFLSLSVLWQPEYNNIHLQLFDGLNPVSIQSLVTNSQKILAIFFWKQAYKALRSKYNCRACVLSKSPKIVWIEPVTPTQQSAPNIKVPIDNCGTKTPQIAHSGIRTLEKNTNDDRESRSTLNGSVLKFGVDSSYSMEVPHDDELSISVI